MDKEKYIEILKKIPPERKLEIALRISSYARQEIISFLRRLNPHMEHFELIKKANKMLEIVENRQFEDD